MPYDPVGHVSTYGHAGALQGDITDDYGNVILSSDTDGSITGDALTEFIQYGVWNGSFSVGPPAGVNSTVDSSNNPMPYWTGPVSVSGGSITCQWVADTGSPSGYSLRFSIAAGGASDEAYVEQVIPVGGDRTRAIAAALRLSGTRTAATSNAFQVTWSYTWLTTGLVAGTTVNGSKVLSSSGDFSIFDNSFPLTVNSPAATRYLRLRIGVKRASAATTDTGTIDLSTVRLEREKLFLMLPDQSDPVTTLPAMAYYSAGIIYLIGGSVGLQGIRIDTNNAVVDIQSLDGIKFSPSTASDPNTLDDYSEGTWTPGLDFATLGNLNVVYSTQLGTYTKIGRLVTCTGQITTSTFTFTTASGSFRITGLPFNVNGTNRAYGAIQLSGWTLASVSSLVISPITGGTRANIVASRSGTTSLNLDQSHFTTGTNVVANFTVSYEV